jgi:hypothetical protein
MPTTDETPDSDETRVDPEPWTRTQYLRDLFKLAPEETLPDPEVVPVN